MTSYVPFLKLKVNEIGGTATLTSPIKERLVPFFDIATKKGITGNKLAQGITKNAKSMSKHLKALPSFFLDNLDIEDNIQIYGDDSYAFAIQAFGSLPFIPVVGLDRRPARNNLVFSSKASGLIKSTEICIRLQAEDFASFPLVQPDLADLWASGAAFSRWSVVLDNRLCLNIDVAARARELAAFIADYRNARPSDRIILTGSSIPSSIGEIALTRTENAQNRIELAIFGAVGRLVDTTHVDIGDYTIVSPLYSEVDIPMGAMMNVMAPRVIYSYDNVHFVARGGALRTDPRGNQQYNDIAEVIINKPFYRGPAYSSGDTFLHEKAQGIGNMVVPGSILKPTINAHMTYMVSRFGLR
jgi:hypothetical protein